MADVFTVIKNGIDDYRMQHGRRPNRIFFSEETRVYISDQMESYGLCPLAPAEQQTSMRFLGVPAEIDNDVPYKQVHLKEVR